MGKTKEQLELEILNETLAAKKASNELLNELKDFVSQVKPIITEQINNYVEAQKIFKQKQNG